MTKITYYAGWLLPKYERNRLLSIYVPKYSTLYAHHITLQFGVKEDYALPNVTKATLIGYSNIDDLEALVFEINGTIYRPDGSIYHCTWSLEKKIYQPSHSNKMIREYGFNNVDKLVIDIEPTLFKI